MTVATTDTEIRAWMTAEGRGHKAAAEHFGITPDEARSAFRRAGSSSSRARATPEPTPQEAPQLPRRGPGRPRRKQAVTVSLPEDFDPLDEDRVGYWSTMLEYLTSVLEEAVDAGNYRDAGVLQVQVGKARKAYDDARDDLDQDIESATPDELVTNIVEAVPLMTSEQRARIAEALAAVR